MSSFQLLHRSNNIFKCLRVLLLGLVLGLPRPNWAYRYLPMLTFTSLSQIALNNSYKAEEFHNLGGSPGLVVMGGDSCAEGREFESQHQDGHFHIHLL